MVPDVHWNVQWFENLCSNAAWIFESLGVLMGIGHYRVNYLFLFIFYVYTILIYLLSIFNFFFIILVGVNSLLRVFYF